MSSDNENEQEQEQEQEEEQEEVSVPVKTVKVKTKSKLISEKLKDSNKAKRHHKVVGRAKLSKGDIHRLARKGGVKRLSLEVYDEINGNIENKTPGLLRKFLEIIIRDTVTYTEHSRRKTVSAMDVVYALKRNGKTLYGFGG